MDPDRRNKCIAEELKTGVRTKVVSDALGRQDEVDQTMLESDCEIFL